MWANALILHLLHQSQPMTNTPRPDKSCLLCKVILCDDSLSDKESREIRSTRLPSCSKSAWLLSNLGQHVIVERWQELIKELSMVQCWLDINLKYTVHLAIDPYKEFSYCFVQPGFQMAANIYYQMTFKHSFYMLSVHDVNTEDWSMFNCVFSLCSLMTVPFSCPIMEATWTWSLPWQSRGMNWRDFRRKEEGEITIASVSVPLPLPSLSPKLQKQTVTCTQCAEMKNITPLLHLS